MLLAPRRSEHGEHSSMHFSQLTQGVMSSQPFYVSYDGICLRERGGYKIGDQNLDTTQSLFRCEFLQVGALADFHCHRCIQQLTYSTTTCICGSCTPVISSECRKIISWTTRGSDTGLKFK